MAAINSRISLYMVQRMGMGPAEVDRLRKQYFQVYGTTMRGLAVHFGIDCADYLAFVHDLTVSDYVHPDPELAAALARLPWTKCIFTNASAAHARRVLAALGVEKQFSAIFDAAWLNFVGKPAKQAYLRVLDALKVGPADCVMVDDSPPNVVEASRLGMTTVMVAESPGAAVCGDFMVERAAQVADLVPQVIALVGRRPGASVKAAPRGSGEHAACATGRS